MNPQIIDVKFNLKFQQIGALSPSCCMTSVGLERDALWTMAKQFFMDILFECRIFTNFVKPYDVKLK